VSRDLDSATITASQSGINPADPAAEPVWFVKLAFDGGDLNLHTRLGPITWGGDTYTGAGDVGGIGVVDEDSELARSTLELSLRGLPTDLLSTVLNEHYQGRTATLYLGYLDPVTQQLVADPGIVYRGRMDYARPRQGETLSIALFVESRFAAWDRPNVRRYNHADQQARYPGDRGLEFVEQTTDLTIAWGLPG
jgi:hypothetical protein